MCVVAAKAQIKVSDDNTVYWYNLLSAKSGVEGIAITENNDEQEKYYTYAGYWIPTLVVPSTDINPERTGNILDVISAVSRDVVIPKMFEIVTKIQNARDEESASMIDIVISNKIYDTAHWLVLTGYQDLVRSIINEGDNVSAGYIRRYHDKAVKDLEDFIEAYEKNSK